MILPASLFCMQATLYIGYIPRNPFDHPWASSVSFTNAVQLINQRALASPHLKSIVTPLRDGLPIAVDIISNLLHHQL
jgi:hypothetical protein